MLAIVFHELCSNLVLVQILQGSSSCSLLAVPHHVLAIVFGWLSGYEELIGHPFLLSGCYTGISILTAFCSSIA